MAMLAAPRRKQKVINLRAKNSEWSNDSSKFGQKMLEKMGWSAGKGLGANENGIVEHVVARYKNDEKGLGFEDKNDQWTKHEDDFNALLANLSNGDVNEEKLHSGQSLEVKSKKSKARVHYHKFTRGKDLSRYSEKDLANIFGKKSLKNTESAPQVQKDDIKTTEQVFTDKGSMEDYFKSKLASFKNKAVSQPEEDYGLSDYGFRGFSNGDDDSQDHGFQGFTSFEAPAEENSTETAEGDTEIKKKRKKKKNKDVESNIDENVCTEINNQDDNIEATEKPKKHKKKKKSIEEVPDQSKEVQNEVTEENVIIKEKKSKKKNKDIEQQNDTTENYVPKKKKKRKNDLAE